MATKEIEQVQESSGRRRNGVFVLMPNAKFVKLEQHREPVLWDGDDGSTFPKTLFELRNHSTDHSLSEGNIPAAWKVINGILQNAT